MKNNDYNNLDELVTAHRGVLKSLIEQDGQYKVNEAQEINNAFGKQLNVVKLKIEAFKMTKEIPTRKELFLPNKTKKGE